MFLLDTNVVSELKKPRPHGAVVHWVSTLSRDELFVSAITIAEIQSGIELTRQQNKIKAFELEQWLTQLTETSQIIAIDHQIAREWARIMLGRSKILGEDAWIAATAKVAGLTVATRNIKDFATFNVKLHNPFTDTR